MNSIALNSKFAELKEKAKEHESEFVVAKYERDQAARGYRKLHATIESLS